MAIFALASIQPSGKEAVNNTTGLQGKINSRMGFERGANVLNGTTISFTRFHLPEPNAFFGL